MIPHGVEIYMALQPIDLRWGFDRLAGVVREVVERDARSGALFVFFGKRRDCLKVLFFDGEAYRLLQLEVEVARRRLAIAKAERIDTTQLELEFARQLRELDRLAGLNNTTEPPAIGDPDPSTGGSDDDSQPGRRKRKKSKHKPTGRRRLSELDMPEERIELTDPALEGTAPRIGTEDSFKVTWRRAGPVRLVVARVKYKIGDGDDVVIATAERPRTLISRALAAPAMLAHIATDKLCDGLPLYRQEDRFKRLGVGIDRGTMSRWLEELGLTVGATLVEAMRKDALAHAFCIATDATGVLVQPLPSLDRQRQACRRGHFVVQIADRDHVFFEYLAKQTGAAIGEMFRGFTGYVQADAASVHHVLFLPLAQRPPPEDGSEPDTGERLEVGCWAHLRRKLWEAAVAKDPVAREGLARIARIYELDRSWRNKSAAEIKTLRDAHLRPHTDAFFVWAQTEYDLVRNQRGLLRTALGYAVRQREPLIRFYDDGRLKLDNNASERELRRIAIGRKNWLFVGSDDHAQAAGNLLTLIASARLHGLDPEAYLRDVFRVCPTGLATATSISVLATGSSSGRASTPPSSSASSDPSPCRSRRPRRLSNRRPADRESDVTQPRYVLSTREARRG